MSTYLPQGLPKVVPSALDGPFWEATARGKLALQRCRSCHKFQWGPEVVCFRCHSFDLGFDEVDAHGLIYSWERPWHPVHQALAADADALPYLVVLVELPHADGVRMVGNLLGDRRQPVTIGAPVRAVFEPNDGYTLVQWQLMS